MNSKAWNHRPILVDLDLWIYTFSNIDIISFIISYSQAS